MGLTSGPDPETSQGHSVLGFAKQSSVFAKNRLSAKKGPGPGEKSSGPKMVAGSSGPKSPVVSFGKMVCSDARMYAPTAALAPVEMKFSILRFDVSFYLWKNLLFSKSIRIRKHLGFCCRIASTVRYETQPKREVCFLF